MSKSDVQMIICKLPQLRVHFDDSESWMSTRFYYLGKCDPSENVDYVSVA